MKNSWIKIKQFNRGHRYYRNDTGQVAIADDSIRLPNRPDTTDDGLLLLDFSREVTSYSSDTQTHWNIPLIRAKDGAPTSAIAESAEAEFIRLLLSVTRQFQTL